MIVKAGVVVGLFDIFTQQGEKVLVEKFKFELLDEFLASGDSESTRFGAVFLFAFDDLHERHFLFLRFCFVPLDVYNYTTSIISCQ